MGGKVSILHLFSTVSVYGIGRPCLQWRKIRYLGWKPTVSSIRAENSQDVHWFVYSQIHCSEYHD